MYGEEMVIAKAAGVSALGGLPRDLNMGQALKAPSDPGVAMEIKLLHAALENLGQRTEHLFGRMEGVLRPSGPATPVNGITEAKDPNLSPVAREISMARHHVGRLLNIINEMHARLDA
jgi:hypothetical protein